MAILTISSKQTLYVLRRLFENFEMKREESTLNTVVYCAFFLNLQSIFNTIEYGCRAVSRAGMRAVLYSAFNRGFGRTNARHTPLLPLVVGAGKQQADEFFMKDKVKD